MPSPTILQTLSQLPRSHPPHVQRTLSTIRVELWDRLPSNSDNARHSSLPRLVDRSAAFTIVSSFMDTSAKALKDCRASGKSTHFGTRHFPMRRSSRLSGGKIRRPVFWHFRKITITILDSILSRRCVCTYRATTQGEYQYSAGVLMEAPWVLQRTKDFAPSHWSMHHIGSMHPKGKRQIAIHESILTYFTALPSSRKSKYGPSLCVQ